MTPTRLLSPPRRVPPLDARSTPVPDTDTDTDTDTVIPDFKEFLGKLHAAELDLRCVSLYASGKKGFHITVPIEVFLPKPPKEGLRHLPAIFKEVAMQLLVDTLDLRVYTAKRGGQFRTVNVLRENGGYKVPLTVEEALNITAEDYPVLCSAPRALPPLAAPEFNQKLGLMFAKAQQRIDLALKKRKDPAVDLALLSRFKGGFPPSLLKVMAGEGTAAGVGFNKIALQIGITANALGKKEEEVLALCAGLIENHVSDGSRYNTPAKRRAELRNQVRYSAGNPCYAFSTGGLISLVPEGVPTPDLDGVPEEAGEVTGTGANGLISLRECASDMRCLPAFREMRRQGACYTSSSTVTSSASRTMSREGFAK